MYVFNTLQVANYRIHTLHCFSNPYVRIVATLLHDVLRTCIRGPQWAPMASPCTPMHSHALALVRTPIDPHAISCSLMHSYALLLGLHQTLIHFQRLEIDGTRSNLIYGDRGPLSRDCFEASAQ